MNKTIRFVCMLLAALCFTTAYAAGDAADFINLTPKPMAMTVADGVYTLPKGIKISVAGLSPEMAAECSAFADALNAATALKARTVKSPKANVTVACPAAIEGDEAYTLDITPKGIKIAANTPTGLYYAFQSIRKMLPANVMAGLPDPAVSKYALPLVSIQDKPRFPYRGFMLDVSRHFFTVDEVKRMLDVMSYYKLNKFHWHLTDDQGWRVQSDKYPLLNTIGATAPNCRITDMNAKTQYWTGEAYGPFFYTKEQLRDVVDYAAKRHIEVIPEFDMPGHFVAALCAYPEYSCDPKAERKVWSDGGISLDVLNVADPKAVQFAKDLLTEVADIFPSPYVHIGGDECPTAFWQRNDQCKAVYQAEGMTSWHQLQSRFVKEIGDHLISLGKKPMVWNESISANGADKDLVKSLDATVFCWTGADKAAELGTSLGLNCIYTPWGPYYINRRQDPNDPPGAGGNGNVWDHVKLTYELVPFRTVDPATEPLWSGVQGTFWTEHVSDREYMEYLALPRLLAIAEAGWTPQDAKDFDDFQRRMSADRKLLDLGGYRYSTYYMLDN